MGFRMIGGKLPKAKTGAGIPLHMKSPLLNTGEEEVQKRYPGAKKRKGTLNEYDWNGVTLIPGTKKKEEISDKEKVKKAIKEQTKKNNN